MAGRGEGIGRSGALGRGEFQRTGIGGSQGIGRSGSLDLHGGVTIGRSQPSPFFRPTVSTELQVIGVAGSAFLEVRASGSASIGITADGKSLLEARASGS